MSVKGFGRALSLADFKDALDDVESAGVSIGTDLIPPADSLPVLLLRQRKGPPPAWSTGYMALCASVALLVGCSPMLLLATAILATTRGGLLAHAVDNGSTLTTGCVDGEAGSSTDGNLTARRGGSAAPKRCRDGRKGGNGGRAKLLHGDGGSGPPRLPHGASTEAAGAPARLPHGASTEAAVAPAAGSTGASPPRHSDAAPGVVEQRPQHQHAQRDGEGEAAAARGGRGPARRARAMEQQ